MSSNLPLSEQLIDPRMLYTDHAPEDTEWCDVCNRYRPADVMSLVKDHVCKECEGFVWTDEDEAKYCSMVMAGVI